MPSSAFRMPTQVYTSTRIHAHMTQTSQRKKRSAHKVTQKDKWQLTLVRIAFSCILQTSRSRKWRSHLTLWWWKRTCFVCRETRFSYWFKPIKSTHLVFSFHLFWSFKQWMFCNQHTCHSILWLCVLMLVCIQNALRINSWCYLLLCTEWMTWNEWRWMNEGEWMTLNEWLLTVERTATEKSGLWS